MTTGVSRFGVGSAIAYNPVYVAKEKGNCVVRRFVKAHFRIA